eukprot:TRINITY_DN4883_c0_g2_i2.p1 TRINITY_DN4883_c0_g2~~TRINITY_DN4883_c0_g2_i2.p1  ORF type:complete len:575 (-),score=86.19 TRINITY_DN4883_c0_g2_i2:951-2675(-)
MGDQRFEEHPLHALCLDCDETVPLSVRIVCGRRPNDHQTVRPDTAPSLWSHLAAHLRGICFACDSAQLLPQSQRANRELVVQLVCSLCKRPLVTQSQIPALVAAQLSQKKGQKSPSSIPKAPSSLPPPLAPSLSDANSKSLQKLKEMFGLFIPESDILLVFTKAKYNFDASKSVLEEKTIKLNEKRRHDEINKSKEEIFSEKVKSLSVAISQWFECRNDEGTEYFVNPSTGAVSWEIPSDFKGLCKPSDEWESSKSPDGRYYYFNVNTKARDWMRPLICLSDQARLRYSEDSVQEAFQDVDSEVEKKRAVDLPSVPNAEKAGRDVNHDKKRLEIFQEVVETERKYIDFLRVISDVFYLPIRHCVQDKSLDESQMQPLLKLLEITATTVINLNQRIFEEFTLILQHWEPNKPVSGIFTTIAPRLKLYSSYIIQHPFALKSLKSASSIPAFKQLLKSALLNSRCEGKDLESFLIMPVQRVPRYVLFLKSLGSVTPPSHPDYVHIQQGIQSLDAVALFLNDSKRTHESAARLSALQESYQRAVEKGSKVVLFSSTGRSIIYEARGFQKHDFRASRPR